MLSYGVAMVLCHVTEADMLVGMLKKDIGDTVSALAIVLPRMVNTQEAAKLARIHVGKSYEKRQKLKAMLGHAYYPLLGHFDGFYCLHLHIAMDRLCFTKLLECSIAFAAQRLDMDKGDVSQCGDWYGFRNQVVDGVDCMGNNPVTRITKANFTPLPKSGRLEFDFSSASRPPKPCTPIHDHRMVRLLHECGLLQHSSYYEKYVHKMLDEMKRGCERTLNGTGYHYWTCSRGRAEAVAKYLNEDFYGNLTSRYDQHIKANMSSDHPGALEAQEEQLGGNGSKHSFKVNPGSGGVINSPLSPLSSKKKSAIADMGESSMGMIEEDDDDDDVEVVDDFDDSSFLMRQAKQSVAGKSPLRMSMAASSHSPPPTKKAPAMPAINKLHMPSFTKSMMQMVSRDVHAARPTQKFQGYKRFEALDSIFNMLGPVHAVPVQDFFYNYMCTHFMLARHLALLLHLYDDGRAKHSDFGTYRVELVVGLFSRVVDVHNFEVVLMQLSAMEHACVIARLGYLCSFNPSKPDGFICLNMSRWEERQVAKILIHLEYAEPEPKTHCKFYG